MYLEIKAKYQLLDSNGQPTSYPYHSAVTELDMISLDMAPH